MLPLASPARNMLIIISGNTPWAASASLRGLPCCTIFCTSRYTLAMPGFRLPISMMLRARLRVMPAPVMLASWRQNSDSSMLFSLRTAAPCSSASRHWMRNTPSVFSAAYSAASSAAASCPRTAVPFASLPSY